jgi:hypothetical protein
MHRGVTGDYESADTAGETVNAFVPRPLPPDPNVALANSRQRLLERATLAIGRLVLSSQIEGTQSTLKERSGGRRNRVFAYDRYLVLLNEGTEPLIR